MAWDLDTQQVEITGRYWLIGGLCADLKLRGGGAGELLDS